MSVLLELRNIHKRYDSGTVALRDMSLTVGEHDFVSLLGPSGCGKSTALKMIAGLPVNPPGQALSPYQSIAADADGNGTVSLADAQAELEAVRLAFNPTIHKKSPYAKAIIAAATERGWEISGVQGVITWLNRR